MRSQSSHEVDGAPPPGNQILGASPPEMVPSAINTGLSAGNTYPPRALTKRQSILRDLALSIALKQHVCQGSRVPLLASCRNVRLTVKGRQLLWRRFLEKLSPEQEREFQFFAFEEDAGPEDDIQPFPASFACSAEWALQDMWNIFLRRRDRQGAQAPRPL